MNIFIRNLPIDVDDEDLKYFFIEYGEVRSAKIIRDHQTGVSRGFGYVNMPDPVAASKAIQELHRGKVEGQEVYVVPARPKKRHSKAKS
jgi:RNA recognition motif-containing protein